MAILVIFLLGVGNFALHKAVLESGHPMLRQMPWPIDRLGARLTLAVEFVVLLTALLLAANGWSGLVWAYLIFSLLNAATAWLILSGRI